MFSDVGKVSFGAGRQGAFYARLLGERYTRHFNGLFNSQEFRLYPNDVLRRQRSLADMICQEWIREGVLLENGCDIVAGKYIKYGRDVAYGDVRNFWLRYFSRDYPTEDFFQIERYTISLSSFFCHKRGFLRKQAQCRQ